MKAITIVATQAIKVVSGGVTANIAKGDKFVLHGRVFSYKGVLVDIDKYQNAFEVVSDASAARIPTYEFINGYSQKTPDGRVVTFEKGTRFETANDVVLMRGVVIDIAKMPGIIREVDVDIEAIEAARLKAEEEARIKVEEDAKAQEEAERLAAETARIQAEEEAKAKAEAEAKAKAEEEARIKAEEEARLKAEEEARLKAEEEARIKVEEDARIAAELAANSIEHQQQ